MSASIKELMKWSEVDTSGDVLTVDKLREAYRLLYADVELVRDPTPQPICEYDYTLEKSPIRIIYMT